MRGGASFGQEVSDFLKCVGLIGLLLLGVMLMFALPQLPGELAAAEAKAEAIKAKAQWAKLYYEGCLEDFKDDPSAIRFVCEPIKNLKEIPE